MKSDGKKKNQAHESKPNHLIFTICVCMYVCMYKQWSHRIMQLPGSLMKQRTINKRTIRKKRTKLLQLWTLILSQKQNIDALDCSYIVSNSELAQTWARVDIMKPQDRHAQDLLHKFGQFYTKKTATWIWCFIRHYNVTYREMNVRV